MNLPTLLYHRGGIAADNAHGRNIAHNHGTRAHHRAITYAAARRQYERIGGNPHVILYHYAVTLMFPFGRIDVMAGGDNRNVIALPYMIAKRYRRV